MWFSSCLFCLQMKCMVAARGQPEDHQLRAGMYSQLFFIEEEGEDSSSWRLMVEQPCSSLFENFIGASFKSHFPVLIFFSFCSFRPQNNSPLLTTWKQRNTTALSSCRALWTAWFMWALSHVFQYKYRLDLYQLFIWQSGAGLSDLKAVYKSRSIQNWSPLRWKTTLCLS